MWISLISYCFIFSNSRFWKISQFLEILVFWIKSFSILSHLPPAWEQNELLKHQHPTPHHWIITIDNITIITLKHQLENKNNNDNIEIPTSTISETKCRELPVFSSMPFVQLETFLLWLWTLNYGFAFQWYQMMPLIIIIIIIINKIIIIAIIRIPGLSNAAIKWFLWSAWLWRKWEGGDFHPSSKNFTSDHRHIF